MASRNPNVEACPRAHAWLIEHPVAAAHLDEIVSLMRRRYAGANHGYINRNAGFVEYRFAPLDDEPLFWSVRLFARQKHCVVRFYLYRPIKGRSKILKSETGKPQNAIEFRVAAGGSLLELQEFIERTPTFGRKGRAVYRSEPLGVKAPIDDTLDDLAAPDYSTFGSDGGDRVSTVRSHVKRDPRVREEVRRRSNGQCERPSCTAGPRYKQFLDVHHILGVQKSDRVWNCVALCPNCHRDAHYAPDAAEINAILLKFAKQFQKKPAKGTKRR